MSLAWFLEGATTGGDALFVPLENLPAHIGRDEACELRLISKDASRVHARIDRTGGGNLCLTDLGSTNGTYVNRQRLSAHATLPLTADDILHFGKSEFRLKVKSNQANPTTVATDLMNMTVISDMAASLPEHFAPQEREFWEMLRQGWVTAAYQPIVDFHDRSLMAYEVLGRGKHPSLPQAPIRLLELASLLGKTVELSQAFRMAGAHAAALIPGPVQLFVNTHPNEMFTEALYDSLEAIQDVAPNMDLVIEVNETAVAEVAKMALMAHRLSDMGIKFAYDDFGAGQSRLNELAEVPPDFVKFDMSLIRNIDQASTTKQNMLARLVHMVKDLGAVTVAEGVETEGEAVLCQHLGFQLCQGYLTGRPVLV
jgi:EAL domain-containing protein (putative c-di-GMP-specific phosphodiesterase class I)